MGAMNIEQVVLASFQLKDIAQAWFKMWQDSRALGRGPITWELFKKDFLERFFTERWGRVWFMSSSTLSKAQWMSWKYSLEIFKLSTYATSLVSNNKTRWAGWGQRRNVKGIREGMSGCDDPLRHALFQADGACYAGWGQKEEEEISWRQEV